MAAFLHLNVAHFWAGWEVAGFNSTVQPVVQNLMDQSVQEAIGHDLTHMHTELAEEKYAAFDPGSVFVVSYEQRCARPNNRQAANCLVNDL